MAKRDGKPETNLPQPVFIDPKLATANPRAAAYAKELAARQGAEARGGGASPPIPLLHGQHQTGMTMADQAAAARPMPQPGMPYQPQMAAPSAGQPQTIFTPEKATQVAQGMNQGLLPTDMLPEAAKQDPAYREGPGGGYAVNQPASLAQRYGVIRNGQHIPGQRLAQGRGGLKPETIEGLKAIQDFQQQRVNAESGDDAAVRAAEAGLAGAAARLANTSGGESVKPVTDDDKKAAEEALRNMDDFDFNSFRELMMKDLLNNDEQRKIVEERLQPLDLADLIMRGQISQVVPIIPGRYEPELQSLTGEEELALKRLLMSEQKTLGAPDRYLLDKFQLMTVACGLKSVNKLPMPTHVDADGQFNDEMFWTKFNRVLKLPFHMLASIGVHYFWFDVRVRKLFVAERLGNG